MSGRRAARWGEAAAVYGEARVLIFGPLGFSAGLPLLLVFGTLSAWLERAAVDRGAIGMLSLVALPYALKFLWAPLLDREPPVFRGLGLRRGWMLFAQIGVALGLLGIAMSDPGPGATAMVALAALFTAFCSATQDIAIDAYRIEAAPEDRQAACAATYVTGYRIGMLLAGAFGALHLAGAFGYPTAYMAMAGLVSVGMITALLAAPTARAGASAQPASGAEAHLCADRRAIIGVILGLAGVATLITLEAEPVYPGLLAVATAALTLFLAIRERGPGFRLAGRPAAMALWARRSYADPLAEFVLRNGARLALFLLAIVLFYRISDLTLGVMANPFYIAIGYSEEEIGTVTKLFGLIPLLLGGFVGGGLTARYGAAPCLLLGAVLVSVTNLVFALLALAADPDIVGLGAVITADNFSAGVATTAFIAFLSGMTERAHAATQYALFSSIMLILGKIIASTSGFVQEAVGWPLFFVYCAGLGLPAIALCAALSLKERMGRPPAMAGDGEDHGYR